MNEPTPGPWGIRRAGRGPDRDVGITAPNCVGVIAECFEEFRAKGDRRPGEAEANARLMVAARDLFEAAKDAQCSCSIAERESGHLTDCWMPALEAAIAKAEGKS